jgi:hypothetical protein
MPTPVGPVPYDPNDPDLWDWGEPDDEGAFPRGRHPWRAAVVGVIVVALVLLIVVSVL